MGVCVVCHYEGVVVMGIRSFLSSNIHPSFLPFLTSFLRSFPLSCLTPSLLQYLPFLSSILLPYLHNFFPLLCFSFHASLLSSVISSNPSSHPDTPIHTNTTFLTDKVPSRKVVIMGREIHSKSCN